ncbi:MAG TPA: M23 family metallopeptidase [Vicinamibacterales bacterium]|nr:M23 family metallopeptidase [Vicinamibacterales bacterium]
MPRTFFLIACLVVGGLHTVMGTPRDAGTVVLDVSTRARLLRPGEVVLLAVSGSRPVLRPEGTGFGVALKFWPAGAGKWRALVGVPLEAAIGNHEISVRAADAAGATASTRVSMNIQRAWFQTRRLQVEDRYADPPDSVIRRIVEEARTLAELFAQSQSERLWRGSFRLPVPGPSTSSYGRLTVLNGKPGSRHQGADFRAALGTPVKAPNAGVVVLASDLYFGGGTVILDHGQGLVSLFAHLSQIGVEVGARVEQGDHLGEAGATGRVTGPHLHWAVRLHGTSVDPLSLAVAVAELTD